MALLRRAFGRERREGSAFLMLMRMGQSNSAAHLQPLADAVAPAILHVVRPAPRPENLTASNVRYWEVHGRFRITEVLGTLLLSLRLAAKFDIRLVMSFNAYPYGVLAGLVSRIYGAPFHVGYVGTDLERLRERPIWRHLTNRALFATTPGVTLSKLVHKAGFKGSIDSLPHGVDGDRFGPGVAARDIDCLFVGTLSEVKRVGLLIESLPHIRKAIPDAVLHIVGSGPLSTNLQKRTAELGLNQLVRFLGHQNAPEFWMQRARLIFFASVWEGLPFALIEGMRCGAVPVVCPAGTIGEVVINGVNGRLVRECTPRAFGAAVCELLSDPHLLTELSANAISSTSLFTFDQVTARWREILETSNQNAGPIA